MLCPKCNSELTSEQKVCVVCGALTPASGYYYDDRRKFKLTKSMRISIYIASGLLFIFIFYLILRITPPQQVASKWLNAMCNRKINYCTSLVTEEFRSSLSEQFSDMREVSDNLYMDSSSSGAAVVVGEPDYRETATEDKAIVPAALVDKNGQTIRQLQVELVKQGRHWKINRMN